MNTDEKVQVEYIPEAHATSSENIVHIVDFGNNFSTAIVAAGTEHNGIIDERNGLITVISESQLQEAAAANGTTYEYIPLQNTANVNENGQTRDALQAALESAEVDKMELLRTADGTVIYENSDSNSQTQTQVSFILL